jgi:GNAT superfamily N-acetyltransferase
MQIKIACLQDAPAILDLQKLAYQSEAAIYNNYAIPPLTQTLEELTVDFEKQVVLKAVIDGKIIGSVRGYLKDGICCIGRVIVHPEFQNQGLGSRLMGAIENRFSQAKGYELFTGEKSARNLYFYQKLGYQIFRTERPEGQVPMVYLEKHSTQR